MGAKVERWANRIALFNPTVHYIPGRENVIADFFSRYVEDICPDSALFSVPAIVRPNPLFEHEQAEIQERKRQ